MSEQSGYTPTFTSSGSALRTLRTGKRNPNWKAAAEYLIERAAPDVRLLIEAATQIEMEKEGLRTDKREVVVRTATGFSWDWLKWVALGAAGLGLLALLIWILDNAALRAC